MTGRRRQPALLDDWPQLQAELRKVAGRVGDLLRSTTDGDATVPGLTWNRAELGAHLVTVAERHIRIVEHHEPFPAGLAAMNAREIAALTTRDCTTLADRLADRTSELLELLGDDGAAPTPFFGMTHTAMGLAGVLLGEFVVHGRDLARSMGEPWSIEPHHARAALAGLMPTLPHIADPAVAARVHGQFHFRIRPDDHYTFTIDAGTVAISTAKPVRADFHIHAEPVTFLLLAYGRANRARATLTGKVVGYGRKPMRAQRLNQLFVET